MKCKTLFWNLQQALGQDGLGDLGEAELQVLQDVLVVQVGEALRHPRAAFSAALRSAPARTQRPCEADWPAIRCVP